MTDPSPAPAALANLRDRFQTLSPNTRYALVFAVGLLVGWIILGWVIFPVQWANTAPSDLQDDIQTEYAQMVADSYALTGNLDRAVARLQYWDAFDATEMLVRQSNAIAAVDAPAAERLRALAEDTFASRSHQSPTPTPSAPQSRPTPEAQPNASAVDNRLLALLGFLLVVLMLLVVVTRLRQSGWRRGAVSSPAAVTTPPAPLLPAESTPIDLVTLPVSVAPSIPPPLSPIASADEGWSFGFDGNAYYNEARNIEVGGEFNGDYGMGAYFITGQQDRDKVYAMEVWLFDKHDSNTTKALLIHPQEFADEMRRQYLAEGRDFVALADNNEIHLQTSFLEVDGHIEHVVFGQPDEAGIPIQQLEVQMRGRRRPSAPV